MQMEKSCRVEGQPVCACAFFFSPIVKMRLVSFSMFIHMLHGVMSSSHYMTATFVCSHAYTTSGDLI